MDYMSIKQTARIRYKTEDNPPMANVPLSGMEIDRDLNAAINIQAVGVDAAIRTQSSRVASCVEASKME